METVISGCSRCAPRRRFQRVAKNSIATLRKFCEKLENFRKNHSEPTSFDRGYLRGPLPRLKEGFAKEFLKSC